MSGLWQTESDIERDLVKYAEYCIPNPKNKQCPIPDTILQYREKMERNKQTRLNETFEPTLKTYVFPGRGKGIKDRIIRPGDGFVSHPSDDIELIRQIREASSLDYSNRFIERDIKANANSKGDTNEPCLKFSSSSSSSDSSTASTLLRPFQDLSPKLDEPHATRH